MKILIVNDSSTPTGGAEIMSLALRDTLQEQGHEARLFSSSALYGSSSITADYTCYGTTSPLRQFLRLANPSAYRQLKKILGSFRPDIIHVRMFTTQLSPIILPFLNQFPSIYHATWHEMICPNGTKTLPNLTRCQQSAGVACWKNGCTSSLAWPLIASQLHLLRRWRRSFTKIVANSYYLANQLQEADWGKPEVIWNGVPIVPQREALSHPPTAAFAGRLIPEKGAHVAICAMAQVTKLIPEARLLVIGDGPQRSYLENLCQSLQLSKKVQFTGSLSRQESEGRLGSSWLQLVPSLCQESFGLVAAEAQMRGTAVIASNRGGLPEIILNGVTGIVVDPEDSKALARGIRSLLTDRDASERMGQAGRIRALREFDLNSCVSKFLNLYLQAIAEHSMKKRQGD